MSGASAASSLHSAPIAGAMRRNAWASGERLGCERAASVHRRGDRAVDVRVGSAAPAAQRASPAPPSSTPAHL
eukprot:5846283-Prymnesium_polylepis.2